MNITVVILVLLTLGIIYILDPELFNFKKARILPIDFACIHPASITI